MAGEYPTHQFAGDSHDRIFGGFTEYEALPPEPAKEHGRRRRWVRTRTQHLSNLRLETETELQNPEAQAGDSARVESADSPDAATNDDVQYGGSSVQQCRVPESPLPGSAHFGNAGNQGGRYGCRKPDGNPVTGVGYGEPQGSDLMAAPKK